MRNLLAFVVALLLSSSVFASDTVSSFNPGPPGPVQSNGTYKLVPFTGCSSGVPLLSWTGACVASASGTPGGASFTTQYNNAGAFGGVGPGTTTTVLHGNASAAPAFSAVDLTADVVNILPGAFGGTGNGFTAFTGPAASLKTFTLPNVSATILTTNAAVTVAQGGTGVGTFTAHGILIGEGTGNVVATAALALDNLLLGQGASADPAAVALVNCGSSTQALAYSTSTHTFSCQTISATATPGGSTTQVQFNLAGAFAGDAGFTYVGSTTQTVTLGTSSNGPTVNIVGNSSTGKTFAINGSPGGVGSDGGQINLAGGQAGSGSSAGGAISFVGGTGSAGGNGGAAAWKGGTPGITGAGGAASLVGGPGGASSGAGGAASVTGGNAAASGAGGAVSVTAGTSAGSSIAGATAQVSAGAGTAAAGSNSQITGGVGATATILAGVGGAGSAAQSGGIAGGAGGAAGGITIGTAAGGLGGTGGVSISATNTTGIGGTGTVVAVAAGTGGTGGNAGVSGSSTGGAGGSGGGVTISAGLGGTGGAGATGGGGPQGQGGTGGAITIAAGNGGASASSAVAGGAANLTGGNAGGTGNAAGGNVVLTAGTAVGTGAPGLVSVASPTTFSSSIKSVGTKFTLGTGTGACATSSTLVGGAVAGSFVCTGTAGASSQVINLPTLPSGGTSYSCTASDATSGVAWATQVGTTSTGKIAGTLTTTSDVVVFHCIGY